MFGINFSGDDEEQEEEKQEKQEDRDVKQPEVLDRAVKKYRHHNILEIDGNAKVLATDHTRAEISEDLEKRSEDLDFLMRDISIHWGRYQNSLERAKQKQGIEQLKAKTRAKEEKKAAKDKEKLWKLLWQEKTNLKDALRRDEHVRVLAGQNYNLDFTEISTSGPEKAAEAMNQMMQERQMKVEQFEKSMESMEEDEVELDFNDIDRDIAELQMQDVDFDVTVEEQGEIPEAVPETSDDWN
jgi:hypothetical protein